MIDLLSALSYGAAYCVVGTLVLIASWKVLDVLTPGKLGEHLHTSHSAALVSATWMVAQGLIIFTAIWTNAESAFGVALAWTLAFSLVGVLLQALAWRLVDAVTPGTLGEEVTVPGPVVPLAGVSAGVIVAVALVVVASIA
ncbi:DUF350 domain-containing protein [Isoptericola dokdonensis]|uniref:DUF350 domain-containing protein n=1 Tax=Isoptericola dokdonensis DS-3 TaxID=1300344 RepID=A0A161HW77_9MICO|nr:DUF350 domain-containing protein [Isoptericola dokdonensis]ANC30443.1 hypothetical protein I598_0868 [Isoptericola dokdonensis DS-3]